MSKKRGKGKKGQNKIVINFLGSEVLERKATGFGTGAHVIIPKEHIGKNVKIIVEDEDGS